MGSVVRSLIFESSHIVGRTQLKVGHPTAGNTSTPIEVPLTDQGYSGTIFLSTAQAMLVVQYSNPRARAVSHGKNSLREAW